MTTANEAIRAYKGFEPDLTCRGFQFAEGETFEQKDPAITCESGFHACESPLDVFTYYPPGTSVYRLVELEDVAERRSGDSKLAGRRIKIGASVSLAGMAAAHVEFVHEHIKKDAKKTAHREGYQSAATNTGDRSAATNTGYQSAATNTGDRSAATNTGYQSAATNTGDRSAATNTGYQSAATNTGYQSAATNTGYRSAATNTGYQSAATNTGDRSAATNTGYQSAATNTGDRSAATNTGDRSAATVEGAGSVAIVTGYQGKASGALGCWLVLTERANDLSIVEVRAVLVDGKKLKADTFYMLSGGKVVSA